MAVLSLTTVGLAVAVTPATAADPGVVVPDPAQRAFFVEANASQTESYLYRSDGSYFGQFVETIASGRAERGQRGDAGMYGASQFERGESRGYGAYYYGPNNVALSNGFASAVTLFSEYGTGFGPTTRTGVPDTASDGTSVEATSATAQIANQDYTDGNVSGLGQPLFASTAHSDGFDPVGHNIGGDSVLDYLTDGSTSDAAVRADWTSTGVPDRRGVSTTMTAPQSNVRLLNDSVHVEVLQGASLVLTADGINPATAQATRAQVRVTDADGNVTMFEPTDGYRTLSIIDPDDPTLKLELSNFAYSGTNGVTGASGYMQSISAGYYKVDPNDPSVRKFLGAVPLGTVRGEVRVPVGGVDTSEVPDSDGDGLNDFVESNRRTDPATADTDGDGLSDGREVGYAGTPGTGSNPLVSDTDGDTVSDGDEVSGVLNTDYAEESTDPNNPDSDFDGLDDDAELGGGTNPNSADTDGDGLGDNVEIAQEQTDPLVADTDDDGLDDGVEVNEVQTDPLDADTDNGGVSDGDEVSAGTDPNNGSDDTSLSDLDSDGLNGAEEVANATDPTNPDTDGDGLTDGAEVNTHGTDPTLADGDKDGLDDGEEIANETNPRAADTDGDGLKDGAEVNTHGTDPTVADSDNDGLDDGAEVNARGTNPLVADTDSDTLDDGTEVNQTDTDPLVADTDSDTLDDGAEVNQTNTDPRVADTDQDGLNDGAEVNTHGTDPNVVDSDGGGVNDGTEVDGGTDPLDPADDPTVVDPPAGPKKDSDKDGLTDKRESRLGTDPRDKDTDNDGLRDYREVVKTTTDPLEKDTDGDILRDGTEVKGFVNQKFDKTFRSNPLRVDTDRDGLRDRVEVTGSRNDKFRNEPTNPRKKDTDGGGIRDLREIQLGSNPADLGSGPRNP